MKRALTLITPELFVQWFQKGNKINYEVVKGLPADARVVTAFSDHNGRIVVTLESEEFSETENGKPLPVIDIELRTIYPESTADEPRKTEEAVEAEELLEPPKTPACDHDDSGYQTTSTLHRTLGGKCLKCGEKKN